MENPPDRLKFQSWSCCCYSIVEDYWGHFEFQERECKDGEETGPRESKEAREEKRKAEKAAAVNKFLTEKGDSKRDKMTLSEMISKKQENKSEKEKNKKSVGRKDKD